MRSADPHTNTEAHSGTSPSDGQSTPHAPVALSGSWLSPEQSLIGPAGYEIFLPSRRIESADLERALRANPGPFQSQEHSVRIDIPDTLELRADVAVRLLSLANQLDYVGKRVRLDFRGRSPVYRYLDRIGFFNHLHANVDVRPERPSCSAADHYRGTHPGLIEIVSLDPARREHTVPSRLELALANAMPAGERRERMAAAAYFLGAELIDNVYRHSESLLNGYAVLQVYVNEQRARLVVTDSGVGLLATMQRSLPDFYPNLIDLSTTKLLELAFREGKVSRLGHGHGAGLKGCADRAIQLEATMEIRQPGSSMRLRATKGFLQIARSRIYTKRPAMRGTHIVLDFPLD